MFPSFLWNFMIKIESSVTLYTGLDPIFNWLGNNNIEKELKKWNEKFSVVYGFFHSSNERTLRATNYL